MFGARRLDWRPQTPFQLASVGAAVSKQRVAEWLGNVSEVARQLEHANDEKEPKKKPRGNENAIALLLLLFLSF